jgi:arginyl-tRNA synthetase
MPFHDLKQALAAQVASQFSHPEITAESLSNELTFPPNIEMGHVALPCFRIGKILGVPAGKLAAELAGKLSSEHVSAKQAGPYVNFKWDAKHLFVTTLSAVFTQADRYGSGTVGKGKTVVLEYCSPNIAKRLGFQHIRSTLIGNVLANVYDYLGYKTERINFVGDWGTQFARLLAAFELWGNKEKISLSDVPQAMDHLLEIYVRFHKEIESKPELGQKATEALQRMERHEPKATELWNLIRQVSCQAMEGTLKRMTVEFNHVEGESTYIGKIDPVLEDIKKKAQARLSEGAWIVEVDGISTPGLIQKTDGTTLYLTRDIAAALDRFNRFAFDRMLYVVSEQQKLHFQLLFGILKKAGYQWADRCEHISFGTVLFGSEKMSTREGRVIFLDDILSDARKLALEECTKKNPDLKNKEEVAEQVGVGAVIFGELDSHRGRDIEFDWKKILALDGETGPYVQYSLVRCASLLEKAKAQNEVIGPPTLPANYSFSSEEEALILTLGRFRSLLISATVDNEPYHLTHYLIDVAKAFNRFYYRFPVLQTSDAESKKIRLQLVKATGIALRNGLGLLGIACPKEM